MESDGENPPGLANMDGDSDGEVTDGGEPASPAPSTPVAELQWQAVPFGTPFWGTKESPRPNEPTVRQVTFEDSLPARKVSTRKSSPTRFQGILKRPRPQRNRVVPDSSQTLCVDLGGVAKNGAGRRRLIV